MAKFTETAIILYEGGRGSLDAALLGVMSKAAPAPVFFGLELVERREYLMVFNLNGKIITIQSSQGTGKEMEEDFTVSVGRFLKSSPPLSVKPLYLTDATVALDNTLMDGNRKQELTKLLIKAITG